MALAQSLDRLTDSSSRYNRSRGNSYVACICSDFSPVLVDVEVLELVAKPADPPAEIDMTLVATAASTDVLENPCSADASCMVLAMFSILIFESLQTSHRG